MGRMMVRANLGIDNVPWAIDSGGKERVPSTWKVWMFAERIHPGGKNELPLGLRAVMANL